MHIIIIILARGKVVTLQDRVKVTIDDEYMKSYAIYLMEIFAMTSDSHLTNICVC